MNLAALKTRLAELYPGTDPLTAAELNAAWEVCSAETEPYNPPEYRATAMTLAADLDIPVAVRVVSALRTVAAAETPLSPIVDEMLRLMRAGIGVDVKNPKTAGVMAAIGISSEDIAAVVAMGVTTRPRYPGLTIADIERSRRLP